MGCLQRRNRRVKFVLRVEKQSEIELRLFGQRIDSNGRNQTAPGNVGTARKGGQASFEDKSRHHLGILMQGRVDFVDGFGIFLLSKILLSGLVVLYRTDCQLDSEEPDHRNPGDPAFRGWSLCTMVRI